MLVRVHERENLVLGAGAGVVPSLEVEANNFVRQRHNAAQV